MSVYPNVKGILSSGISKALTSLSWGTRSYTLKILDTPPPRSLPHTRSTRLKDPWRGLVYSTLSTRHTCSRFFGRGFLNLALIPLCSLSPTFNTLRSLGYNRCLHSLTFFTPRSFAGSFSLHDHSFTFIPPRVNAMVRTRLS